jgi:hypothetical protein
MQRAREFEDSQPSVGNRGAESSAPRSTPLTLVAGAVAGGDLQGVATTVAQALDCPVAIAIPALGEPVVHPPGSLADAVAQAIAAHAGAIIDGDGDDAGVPPVIAEAVPVRIGERTVGIVAAAADSGDRHPVAERRAWLEAAAAAASVTALICDAHPAGLDGHGQALLLELVQGTPDDLTAFLGRARRLGLRAGAGRLIAELGAGCWLAVTAIAGVDDADPAAELAQVLRGRGMTVAV